MTVKEIIEVIDGRLICGEVSMDKDISTACASDLMSDVLTLDTDKLLLITGLMNLQTIRTAEMSDVEIILFVRNKKTTAEMINLAKDSGITLIESPGSMYNTCGKLYEAGLKPVY
jgi:predicted transcriptional regulator